MRELSSVEIQQGYHKKSIKKKIKSVHIGNRDLAIKGHFETSNIF